MLWSWVLVETAKNQTCQSNVFYNWWSNKIEKSLGPNYEWQKARCTGTPGQCTLYVRQSPTEKVFILIE